MNLRQFATLAHRGQVSQVLVAAFETGTGVNAIQVAHMRVETQTSKIRFLLFCFIILTACVPQSVLAWYLTKASGIMYATEINGLVVACTAIGAFGISLVFVVLLFLMSLAFGPSNYLWGPTIRAAEQFVAAYGKFLDWSKVDAKKFATVGGMQKYREMANVVLTYAAAEVLAVQTERLATTTLAQLPVQAKLLNEEKTLTDHFDDCLSTLLFLRVARPDKTLYYKNAGVLVPTILKQRADAAARAAGVKSEPGKAGITA